MNLKGRMGVIRYANMTGGEASVFSAYNMPSKYSWRLENCHVSGSGGIEKIPGYIKVHEESCGVTLTSGYEFLRTDGTRHILVAGGGCLFEYDEGTSTLNLLYDELNKTAKVNFTTFGDICIITNGINNPLKYDGDTVSMLGGEPPPTAFKAHVHKGRVWMLEKANTMLATFSGLNNPEDYSGETAGYIDFTYVLKEGDELLDIATYVDLLVFFFREHIAIYSGSIPVGVDSDFQLVQLIEGCGVKCPGSVKGVGADMFFIHDAGVKSLKQVVTTGALTLGEVSQIIAPSIQKQIAVHTSYGVAHYPAKSWIMFFIGGNVWIYSYLFRAWARMTGAPIYGLFDTAQGEVFLCGDGYLYKYGMGYSFDGEHIFMRWESAYVPFDGRSGRIGFPRFIEGYLRPTSSNENLEIIYQLKYDYELSDALYVGKFPIPKVGDEGVVDFNMIQDFDKIEVLSAKPAKVPVCMRAPAFGRGKSMQICVLNESSQGPIEIDSFIIYSETGGI